MITPLRPLTARQLQVFDLVGRGCDYDTIAATLGMKVVSARVHVYQIAALYPNPDGLKPYTLVLLAAAHARWLKDHEGDVPSKRTA